MAQPFSRRHHVLLQKLSWNLSSVAALAHAPPGLFAQDDRITDTSKAVLTAESVNTSSLLPTIDLRYSLCHLSAMNVGLGRSSYDSLASELHLLTFTEPWHSTVKPLI